MGSQNPKHPPDPGFAAQKFLGKIRGIGDTEWVVPLLAPGLQARGCLPRASMHRAVNYHGSSWLKPLPVPERKGSENPTQPPDHGVSAEKFLRNSEKWETQNPMQPLQGLCSEHKIPRQTYA